MDTEVEGSTSVNPDLEIAPQPNNEGGRLNKQFSEAELQGIKDFCRGPNLQTFWTTLVLTEFQSVTLVLCDWLIRGREHKFWGGAAPPSQ